MVKSKGRGRVGKKNKLVKRRAELRSNHGKPKKNAPETSKIKKKKITKKQMYTPEMKILLVGEGNFSFARALIRKWEKQRPKVQEDAEVNEEEFVGFKMVATCYDSKEALTTKYPDVNDIVREIKAYGASVHAGIDATRLLDSKRVVKSLSEICEFDREESDFGFDRVIFNFPHLGCGIKDTEANSKQHRDMLEKFFASAHGVLAVNGQVHVTVKIGDPYDSWQVPKCALKTGLLAVHSSVPFDPIAWDGYQHRRTLGAPTNELPSNRDIDSDKASARTLVFISSKRNDSNTEQNLNQSSDSD